MKKTTLFVALLSVAVLAGCVPCLRAIYTDRDLVFDPGLVGLWKQADGKGTWQFAKAEGKSYELVFTDQQGRRGEFSAHLVNIDQSRLVDLYPRKRPPENPFYAFHFRPVHTFLRVDRIGPELCMSAMSPKWLDEHLKANAGAVRHERTGNDVLLTASTEDLQSFLAKHVNTEAAWAALPTMKKETQ
ncbi:MAG: hypothetical protein ACYTG0_30405 [Planctomycetota bacterium]|jgi:hypothetical protein